MERVFGRITGLGGAVAVLAAMVSLAPPAYAEPPAPADGIEFLLGQAGRPGGACDAAWREEFRTAHGWAPGDRDCLDRIWSLSLAQASRAPSGEDWARHFHNRAFGAVRAAAPSPAAGASEVAAEDVGKPGSLGIYGYNHTPSWETIVKSGARWGVVIVDILPGSPAEAAGLRVGDVMTASDGVTMKDSGDFNAASGTWKAGDRRTLTIRSGGVEKRVTFIAVPEESLDFTPESGVARQTKAIQDDPANPVLYVARSSWHYEAFDDPAAIADLSRAIALSPGAADLYYQRASVNLATWQDNPVASGELYESIIADLSRAIGLDPSVAVYYVDRSFVYEESGQFAEALPDAATAIRLDPNGFHGWDNFATALVGLGRYQQALPAVDRCISLQAQYGECHYVRGQALEGLGRRSEAIDAYTRALAVHDRPQRLEAIQEGLDRLASR